MTPNEIQNELNRLQAELDRLKQADTYFPESGEVVWVSDDLEEWHKRIFIKFIGFNSSPYKCVWENKSNTTKNYLLGKNYITSDWAYCRRMDGEIIPFGRDKYNTDYSHLLPDGYEFCAVEEAEKWVKVEMINTPHPQMKIGTIATKEEIAILTKNFKDAYRPIRPIQYHVAVHEAVTAEPNPYSVDWSNAPDWAELHAFDSDGKGYWYGVRVGLSGMYADSKSSGFTLPTGLDWKQSKTIRP